MRSAVMVPAMSPRIDPGWAGFRGIDRAIVLDRVSSLLAEGASRMGAAEVLTAVSEAAAVHLALTAVVLYKRIAGQARTLGWSAPGVSATRLLAAREQVWSRAAERVDCCRLEVATPRSDADGDTALLSLEDASLGLSVLLYVESLRTLDRQDRWLLEEIVRRMLGMPGARQP